MKEWEWEWLKTMLQEWEGGMERGRGMEMAQSRPTVDAEFIRQSAAKPSSSVSYVPRIDLAAKDAGRSVRVSLCTLCSLWQTGGRLGETPRPTCRACREPNFRLANGVGLW